MRTLRQPTPGLSAGTAGRARHLLRVTHGWAGAVSGALLFIVCFSGSWAVVGDELRYWQAHEHRRPAPKVLRLDAALAAARDAGIDPRDATLSLPQGGQRELGIGAGRRQRGEAPRRVAIDPESGQTLAPMTSAMAEIVITLHKNLYAGFPGRVVVSLFGVTLTVLALGGLVLHTRRWRDFTRLRAGTGWRGLALGAHKLVGLWLLPWIVLIAVTGIFCGLGALGTITLARFAYEGGTRQAMAELSPLPPDAVSAGPSHGAPASLDALLQRHLSEHPDLRPQALSLHRWGSDGAMLTISGTRQGLLSTAVFEKNHYLASNGALQRQDSISGRGFWLQSFVAVQPLHFAQYGGGGVKLLHFAAGLGASLLAASGLWLWLARQRALGQSATAMRISALAACGGLPAATASLMLASALAPSSAPATPFVQRIVFWGVWVLMAALPCWPGYRRHAGAIAAAIAGGGFVLAGSIDAVRGLTQQSWLVAAPSLLVDAVAVSGGAGLLLLARQLHRNLP